MQAPLHQALLTEGVARGIGVLGSVPASTLIPPLSRPRGLWRPGGRRTPAAHHFETRINRVKRRRRNMSHQHSFVGLMVGVCLHLLLAAPAFPIADPTPLPLDELL